MLMPRQEETKEMAGPLIAGNVFFSVITCSFVLSHDSTKSQTCLAGFTHSFLSSHCLPFLKNFDPSFSLILPP